ncbi:creatininase family protein [Actinophytocola gossypii]|uniref:Creatininase family protein n=1 Tax=Actinophytocola gossypii TaxID=2812003 RepID=A0ABT2J4T3_9PSEU|nr:creatininase family protein [Actinophytocola gossypii]MCT2582294.1 creatininase family protein [Actinophytocola gossypii]
MKWAELTWEEIGDAVAARPVALLPFGAVEEHGPHLTLGADNDAADGIAERLAEAANLLLLPTVPYGQVWSLERFPGSLSVRDETLVNLVTDLADGLARNGVRGLVLMSAHLGNAAALRRATRVLAEKAGLPALHLTYPGLAEISARVRTTPESRPGIMHADEIETSILLALRPERVHLDRARPEYPYYPADFDAAPVRWDEVSTTGVFGDPTRASAETGEAVLEHVVGEATRVIEAWRGRLA